MRDLTAARDRVSFVSQRRGDIVFHVERGDLLDILENPEFRSIRRSAIFVVAAKIQKTIMPSRPLDRMSRSIWSPRVRVVCEEAAVWTTESRGAERTDQR